MNNSYIVELIKQLHNTEIWQGTIEKYLDYNKGIKVLIDTFTYHKKNHTQVFFMKNGGMNTYSLYDNSVTTCMGNDYGYEYIFAKPMGFLVRPDDLVIAISSSGNSPNILCAIEVAKKKKATVITFTGFQKDNKAKQMGDINVYVPCNQYGIVESIHNLILQQIVDEIMERDGVEL